MPEAMMRMTVAGEMAVVKTMRNWKRTKRMEKVLFPLVILLACEMSRVRLATVDGIHR